MNQEPKNKPLLENAAIDGAFWMVGGKVFLAGIYLLISIVLVKGLGKERFGLYSLCKAMADYLIPLCTLGLNTALLRFIPELMQNKNYSGLKKLLWKSALLQGAAVALAALLLSLLTPQFNKLFSIQFGINLFLTGLLIGSQIAKDFLSNIFTALFKVKRIVLLSVIQGVSWLFLLWLLLQELPYVSTALLIQSGTLLFTSCITLILLVYFLRSIGPHPIAEGIGKWRALQLSLSTCLNSMLRMLMNRYTEVFFLGVYFPAAVVGIYDLGYTMTVFAITLIPSALHSLLLSSFSNAYVQQPEKLPQLITTLYKIFCLLILPISAFGFFFSPQLFVLLYGEEMLRAGEVASAFSAIQPLSLYSVPLSMAIVAKEKVHSTIPLLLFQISVNLFWDWLLIPTYEIPGAIAAVLLTFFATLPMRVFVVRRIIGGIYFPILFTFKMILLTFGVAGIVAWFSPRASFLDLAASGLIYGSALLGLILYTAWISEKDLRDIRSIGIVKINFFLDWILSKRTSQN